MRYKPTCSWIMLPNFSVSSTTLPFVANSIHGVVSVLSDDDWTIRTLLEHADELFEIEFLVDALDCRQCLSPVALLNAA